MIIGPLLTGYCSSFGGLLVTSFGFVPKKALQLTMPASGVAVFSMVFSGYCCPAYVYNGNISDKFQDFEH
jgi:hypothetical protein